MKIIISKNEVVEFQGFSCNCDDAILKLTRLLTHNVSSKVFSGVMAKLKQDGYLDYGVKK